MADILYLVAGKAATYVQVDWSNTSVESSGMLVVPSLLLPPVTSRACSTQLSHDVTSRRPHRLSTGRDELAAGVVVPALLQVCQVLHLAGLGVAGHCAQVGVF